MTVLKTKRSLHTNQRASHSRSQVKNWAALPQILRARVESSQDPEPAQPDLTPRTNALNTLHFTEQKTDKDWEEVVSGSTAQSEMRPGLGSDPSYDPPQLPFRGAQQWGPEAQGPLSISCLLGHSPASHNPRCRKQ